MGNFSSIFKQKNYIFWYNFSNIGKTIYMKFFKNLFLYFSAFVPLFVLLLVKISVDLINKNLTFNTLNTLNLCILTSLVICGIFGLLWNTLLSDDESFDVEIVTCKETTDQYFLQYFSLFVMFAVPLDISYVNEFCIYILVLIFIGIVYINCGLYYINPLLNILGFRFYDAEYILSNGERRKAKIFSRKKLTEKSVCKIRLKNEHFAFVTKNSNKK